MSPKTRPPTTALTGADGDVLLAQREAEADQRDDAHFAGVDFHQAAGQNRAALILRDGEQGAADHILERVLGELEALALDLRQLRVFHRVKAVDRGADARAADRRLHPLADGDVARAARQLADDFAEQLARQNGAAFLAERRGQQGFNAQCQIGAGEAEPFVAGLKQDALQNRLGGAHGQRAADDGEGGIQFVGIADKTHFDNLHGVVAVYTFSSRSRRAVDNRDKCQKAIRGLPFLLWITLDKAQNNRRVYPQRCVQLGPVCPKGR